VEGVDAVDAGGAVGAEDASSAEVEAMNDPGPPYCGCGAEGRATFFFSGGFSFDQNVISKYTSPEYLSLFRSVNHSSFSPLFKASERLILTSPMRSGSRGSSA
jgi:hypothetical protein